MATIDSERPASSTRTFQYVGTALSLAMVDSTGVHVFLFYFLIFLLDNERTRCTESACSRNIIQARVPPLFGEKGVVQILE